MREVVAWALSIVITLMFMVVGGNIYLKIRNALSKRPHKSDDEEDNPIVKFKDDLADICENYPNGKLQKLAQAVWNRIEEIEKWHNTEMNDMYRKERSARYRVGELENKCEDYQSELDEWTKRCEELQSKLNESQERLKRESAKVKTLESETDKLRDVLKEKEQPDFLIEKRFPGQTNSFAKIILNTKPGEPLTATEATELAERLMNMTSQPIVMDSEALNEPQIKNEEFIKQLRDWWGLEAQKAVELPNTDKERLSADELRRKYAWFLALYKNPNNEPLKRFKVRVIGTYNNDRDSLLTDWILPATSINEIRNVLGEDGIRVLGGEELPI